MRVRHVNATRAACCQRCVGREYAEWCGSPRRRIIRIVARLADAWNPAGQAACLLRQWQRPITGEGLPQS